MSESGFVQRVGKNTVQTYAIESALKLKYPL